MRNVSESAVESAGGQTGIFDRIDSEPRYQRLRNATMAVLIAGLASAGIESHQELAADAAVSVESASALKDNGNSENMQQQVDDVVATEETSQSTSSSTSTTTTSVFTPSTQLLAEATWAKYANAEFVQPMDARSEAAINAMDLTPDGYRNFLASIDQSFFEYAQQYGEYNPDISPIEQSQSEFFVWHFTAGYYNADGSSEIAYGPMNVGLFIDGTAKRGGEVNQGGNVCCGVNWLVDRSGHVFQLAPVNAKLRHNPPYDSVNTGVEIEAARQEDITIAQYEATSYLTIAVLNAQGLLSDKPLADVAVGHGEIRDSLRTEYPEEERYGHRDDFDTPVSSLLRHKIAEFIFNYPNETIGDIPSLR